MASSSPSSSPSSWDPESTSRLPSESLRRKVFPLSTDSRMRDEFMSHSGEVRLGRILEEMDWMAGMVAYGHAEGADALRLMQLKAGTSDDAHPPSSPVLKPRAPDEVPSTLTSSPSLPSISHPPGEESHRYVIVTASCDRITLSPSVSLDLEHDLRLTGRITYVGKSSMEVNVELEQQSNDAVDGDGWRSVMTGYFVMVARDPETYSAATVPRLAVESEEDEAIWKRGEENNRRRKQERVSSTYTTVPSEEESTMIHDLYVKHRHPIKKKKEGSDSSPDVVEPRYVSPAETRHEAARFMHPQYKNIHGKIFGGYLLRQALELAYMTSTIFASTTGIRFISMDDVAFLRPVSIGTILSCNAEVIHTNPHSGVIHVMVTADVIDPASKSRETTNTFLLSFVVTDETCSIPLILPETYSEAMNYVLGFRRDCETTKIVKSTGQ